MWIIKCTGLRTNRNVIVGPFGADDQALKVARELEASDGRVGTDVRPPVEPGRARPSNGRSDVLLAATKPGRRHNDRAPGPA